MGDKFLWIKRLMIFAKGSSDKNGNSPALKRKTRRKSGRNKAPNSTSHNNDTRIAVPSLIGRPEVYTPNPLIITPSETHDEARPDLNDFPGENLSREDLLYTNELDKKRPGSFLYEKNKAPQENSSDLPGGAIPPQVIESQPSNSTLDDSIALPIKVRPRSTYSSKSIKSNSKSVVFSLESITLNNDSLLQYTSLNNDNSLQNNGPLYPRAHSLSSLNPPVSIISNLSNDNDYARFTYDNQVYFNNHNSAYRVEEIDSDDPECSGEDSDSCANNTQDTEGETDTDGEDKQNIDLDSMETISTVPTSISPTSSSTYLTNIYYQQRHNHHQTSQTPILLSADTNSNSSNNYNNNETASTFSYSGSRDRTASSGRNGDQDRYRDELASIITLASSSKVAWYKNTRRSLDTNASIRGIPPMSLFEGNGSFESLALL